MSFRAIPYTPTPSRYSRPASPPSSSNGITAFGQQKLNIVTRLALEGKTNHSWDGASIKMYLKISLPLDSVTPGSSIPLFPEENVKIFDSQVHPIDSSGAPYNFSSTTCRLLNKAAKALNLPGRSPQSYISLFRTSSSLIASSSRYSPTFTSGAGIPPLDERYTGSILVSGYNVTFVLPKDFPPRFRESEVNGYSIRGSTTTPSNSKRRNSASEKNVLQFMAAIDMWVPYVCCPPKAPYLLSIPTPRCLSNHIKLRIFSPSPSTSTSYTSLSSAEDDISSWDLTSDPHVTRTSTGRHSRSSSYNDSADDESSDSASAATPGFADGCGIQGTFPSAERIRVRWAAPLKANEVPETADGRRRVGVRDVKGEMTCVVLGKRKEGLVVQVDYKGTCKGVWFAGVATLLGMDVSLDAPHCKISWITGMESKWSVNGSIGFTGFAVGPPLPILSRNSSIGDVPDVVVSPASPNGPNTTPRSRRDSSSSTASLLRAPLPTHSVADYSFETSNASLSTGTMSSLGSLSPRSRPSSLNGVEGTLDRPPTVPITLHLNMNDLLPPSNNNLIFNISGIILISPRSKWSEGSSDDSEDDLEESDKAVLVPKFRVLTTDAEVTSFIVRSEVADSLVEVSNIGDVKTRKTLLQKGGVAKCGTEGARIILRPVAVTSPSRREKEERGTEFSSATSTPSNPHTPTGAALTRYASNSALRQMVSTLKPKRDGPLMIPSVVATVTVLARDGAILPNAYAVRISLPAPSDSDSEWLDFGLAQAGDTDRPPQVEVASASIQGVPVRFETTAAVKEDMLSKPSKVLFDQMSGKEWVSWVRVHVGELGGEQVEVVYLTKAVAKDAIAHGGKGKQKAWEETAFDVLLPTFSLPVGRLEVNLEVESEFKIIAVSSNLDHQQTYSHGRKLLHYSMADYFYPVVTITIVPTSTSSGEAPLQGGPFINILWFITWTLPAVSCVVLFIYLTNLKTELRQTKTTLDSCSSMMEMGRNEPEPVTVSFTTTMTVFSTPSSSASSSGSKWWFSADDPVPTPTAPDYHPIPVNDAPSTAYTPTLTSTVSPMPSSSPSNGIDQFTKIFPWTIDLKLPPADVLAGTARRGLVILWCMLQKLYHYPLNP